MTKANYPAECHGHLHKCGQPAGGMLLVSKWAILVATQWPVCLRKIRTFHFERRLCVSPPKEGPWAMPCVHLDHCGGRRVFTRLHCALPTRAQGDTLSAFTLSAGSGGIAQQSWLSLSLSFRGGLMVHFRSTFMHCTAQSLLAYYLIVTCPQQRFLLETCNLLSFLIPSNRLIMLSDTRVSTSSTTGSLPLSPYLNTENSFGIFVWTQLLTMPCQIFAQRTPSENIQMCEKTIYLVGLTR